MTSIKTCIAALAMLCIVLTFFSCEEESNESSPILVFLTPSDTQLEANSNDRLFITVSASTSIGNNLALNISSEDNLFGIQTLFDSTFSRTEITYRYEYIVPQYPDSTQVLLVFTLANDISQAQVAKKVLINRGASLVTERTGEVIFSSASDNPNAYSLSELTSGFLADSASFDADIVDDTTSVNDDLSRTWISNTGLSFVQFNSFNYAAANSLTIQSAYENGSKRSKISGLSNNQIYLVGRGNEALGVVQINFVTDEDGAQDDSYTFSVKVIDN